MLTIKEVPAFVKVDLKVGNLYMELKVFLHGIDVVENIIDNPEQEY